MGLLGCAGGWEELFIQLFCTKWDEFGGNYGDIALNYSYSLSLRNRVFWVGFGVREI